jgi:hypothetical protein
MKHVKPLEMPPIIRISGYLLIVVFFIVIYILYFYNPKTGDRNYNLNVDGVQLYEQFFSSSDISYMNQLCREEKYDSLKRFLMNHPKLRNEINENFFPRGEYQLHDYIFIIKKSNIHTCHRDNNGSFYNKSQKYPSYTMIIYLRDQSAGGTFSDSPEKIVGEDQCEIKMENKQSCLSIVPTSHKTPQNRWWWNITQNPLETVGCNKGDVIIFDANVIHAGTLPTQPNNWRIQMKISHREDLRDTLSFYQNYHKMLDKDNNLSTEMNKFQQNISCMFPIFSENTKKKRAGRMTKCCHLYLAETMIFIILQIST